MLKDLSFSDLILFDDGTAKIKGVPNEGEKLLDLPKECLAEIENLKNLLAEAFLTRKVPPNGTIRYSHNAIAYRVSFVQNISEERTWFLRKLSNSILSLEELGYYEYIKKFLLDDKNRSGLLLFSGSQASGKTTGASSLIHNRLAKYGGHAITIENPAELPLGGQVGEYGYCVQSEIFSELELEQQIVNSFRYSAPNIIFIGEIRTKYAASEILRLALSSRELLVVATIHGMNIENSLTRLLNWAKEIEGENAYLNLSNSLLGVIHQELKTKNNKKHLEIPECLFIPFNEKSQTVRNILASGNLQKLQAEINLQRNNLAFGLSR